MAWPRVSRAGSASAATRPTLAGPPPPAPTARAHDKATDLLTLDDVRAAASRIDGAVARVGGDLELGNINIEENVPSTIDVFQIRVDQA